MELLFLGTGAGLPSRGRNVSSVALKLLDELNEVWLFDCGEATQHQILRTSLRPRKITKIFISHMHGDHIYGLPGLLSSRSFQGGDNEVLSIYGPKGIKDYVMGSLRASRSRLTYRIHFVELSDESGAFNLEKNWRLKYQKLDHGIPSYGYRVEEPSREGELLIDRLKAYNIPNGPIFGQLKNKQTVTLADGTLLDGRDFVGPDVAGRHIVIFGDTRPKKGLEEFVREADVLVHESTYAAGEEQMAYQHFHSTSAQAARLARAGDVKQLYLTHISARYVGKQAQQLEKEAQAIHPSSKLVYDLDEFKIHLKKDG